MEPTIFAGEKLVIDENYYHHHSVQRRDISAIRKSLSDSATTSGRRETLLVIKRVVAIAGDTIEGKNQQIFVNRERQDEPYIQHKFKARAGNVLDTFGPITVPPGKFFVLGDNRDVSLDSRSPEFGLVDAQSIMGKPIYAYRIIGDPHSWELH